MGKSEYVSVFYSLFPSSRRRRRLFSQERVRYLMVTLFPFLLTLLHDNLTLWLLGIPPILMAADVLTGVISAIKRGVFSFPRLSDVLGKDLSKYVTVFITVLVAYFASGSLQAAQVAQLAGMGALGVSLVTSIGQNIIECLPLATPFVQQAEQQLNPYIGSMPPPTTLPSQAQEQQQSPSYVFPQQPPYGGR